MIVSCCTCVSGVSIFISLQFSILFLNCSHHSGVSCVMSDLLLNETVFISSFKNNKTHSNFPIRRIEQIMKSTILYSIHRR
jgi:hypothetical protein